MFRFMAALQIASTRKVLPLEKLSLNLLFVALTLTPLPQWEYFKAKRVFQEDLRRRPNGVRSLYGVWQSLIQLDAGDGSLADAKKALELQWGTYSAPDLKDF